MMAAKLPPERRNALLAEYLDGVPIATLAGNYGVHKSYPAVLARRAGILRRQPHTFERAMRDISEAPVTEVPRMQRGSSKDQIVALRERGFSDSQIATMLRLPYREIADAWPAPQPMSTAPHDRIIMLLYPGVDMHFKAGHRLSLPPGWVVDYWIRYPGGTEGWEGFLRRHAAPLAWLDRPPIPAGTPTVRKGSGPTAGLLGPEAMADLEGGT